MVNGNPKALKVAIFGSGPSGFYAAEELLAESNPEVRVDMFDRLPTPFGLVRGGVAPDHQKIKSVIKIYEKTAGRPGFRFFGNVEFGRELSLEDLKNYYDAAIFAVGAKSDRKMGIPGEDLSGSFAATAFVGWYNAHPDYQDLAFDLSCERVAVIGNGNVAVDVARILARDPETLKTTDISEAALSALRKSKIKEIVMIGRRGPAQAQFTNPEIRELCELPGADLIVDPKELDLDALSIADLEVNVGGTKSKGNVDILKAHSLKAASGKPRKLILKFLASPVELLGKAGQVSQIRLEKNKLARDQDGSLKAVGTGVFETYDIGLVLRSIGYKGVPVPGLPYDDKKGTIPNSEGRIVDAQLKPIPGLYVVGWAKRGPSGVIGTNKPDSIDTARRLLEDAQNKITLPGANICKDVSDLFKEKKLQTVSFEDWKKLDQIEMDRGKSSGKVRDKFSTIPEMLSALK